MISEKELMLLAPQNRETPKHSYQHDIQDCFRGCKSKDDVQDGMDKAQACWSKWVFNLLIAIVGLGAFTSILAFLLV